MSTTMYMTDYNNFIAWCKQAPIKHKIIHSIVHTYGLFTIRMRVLLPDGKSLILEMSEPRLNLYSDWRIIIAGMLRQCRKEIKQIIGPKRIITKE